MNTATLIAALLIAQPQVPPVPQAPPVKEQPDAEPKPKEETYSEAQTRAIREGKPLVVFVGSRNTALPVGISVVVSRGYFLEYPQTCIIVSDREGFWKATLPADATDKQIADAVKGAEPAANPFHKGPLRRVERARTADDSDLLRQVPHLTFLQKLTRYESAKNTQAIYQLQSNGGPFLPTIDIHPRTVLEQKYVVPGGLIGADGWRSNLYASGITHTYQAKLPVVNSDGYMQHELGWTRTFDDGAVFADVLFNETGKVFEVRAREKIDGKWQSFVAYKNPDARPVGYVPVKVADCRRCHDGDDGPGTGRYGVAMVSGSDGVFSLPFAALER